MVSSSQANINAIGFNEIYDVKKEEIFYLYLRKQGKHYENAGITYKNPAFHTDLR